MREGVGAGLRPADEPPWASTTWAWIRPTAKALGDVVNPEVAAIDAAQAFAAAEPMAPGGLARITQLSSGAFALRHPDGRPRLPVDLMNFCEHVLAG